MVNLRNTYQRWPKWLRILFLISGFLFIALSIIVLSRNVANADFKNYPLIFPDYGADKFFISVVEILVVWLTFQTITLILKQGKNFKTFATSIFIGPFGVLLVLILENYLLYFRQNFYLFYVEQFQYISYLETTIQEIDPSLLPTKNYDTPLMNIEETNTTILTITAISGLITAITGLIGQFISARKIKVELELAKQQLLLAQKKIELEANKQNKDK